MKKCEICRNENLVFYIHAPRIFLIGYFKYVALMGLIVILQLPAAPFLARNQPNLDWGKFFLGHPVLLKGPAGHGPIGVLFSCTQHVPRPQE
ncbi:hypothetical protein [Sulfidibacter corallicola]|uniref:Uncharacterized protein n=1 Tax=Sulfidibacter corallicola TaxID=2818388 RepID=A0A8A4TJT3_SULCO|nr:hypothetical protein [Sulfidibacter corallicola]QTD50289.1 hypothetical protein J3U87_32290 [Sulfidibacter corallicola]